MNWKQISALAIGATLIGVGAFTGTLPAMLPVGTTIIGGVLGMAQAQRNETKKAKDI